MAMTIPGALGNFNACYGQICLWLTTIEEFESGNETGMIDPWFIGHRLAWKIYQWSGINPHDVRAAILEFKNRASGVRPFDRLPLSGVGAEIGVHRGIHAHRLLKRHRRISMLYLCDAYVPYGGKEAGECELLNESRISCKTLLRPFQHRIHRLPINSPECAEHLPQLDFCYIDGGHTYEMVMADLLALWPKISSGGFIGGHDFGEGFPGVVRAVVEFASDRGQVLHAESPDWWIKKDTA